MRTQFFSIGASECSEVAIEHDSYKIIRNANICTDFEMFEVKVPINFLGAAGFWLRTEGHYLFATWYSGLAKEIISNPVEHNLSADPGMVIACAMRNLYLFQLAFYGRVLAASDLPPTRVHHHRSQEGGGINYLYP